MTSVAVIDFGMGNIGSICKMLRFVGATPVVTSESKAIAMCERIVLPGVGHFDRAVSNLTALGLVEGLRNMVRDEGKPLLGICLGMQLLCRTSEEGSLPGLGLIDARVRRFEPIGSLPLKVPHMGWSQITPAKSSSLLDGIDSSSRFYFVHSYFVECFDRGDVLAEATYGVKFAAAVERGGVVGVQFHPEKSHRFGVQMFRNFVGIRA
jgi:glutamine amidotransferase